MCVHVCVHACMYMHVCVFICVCVCMCACIKRRQEAQIDEIQNQQQLQGYMELLKHYSHVQNSQKHFKTKTH